MFVGSNSMMDWNGGETKRQMHCRKAALTYSQSDVPRHRRHWNRLLLDQCQLGARDFEFVAYDQWRTLCGNRCAVVAWRLRAFKGD